jgi:predicted RNA methylase
MWAKQVLDQYYTPDVVATSVADVIESVPDAVCDPSCGDGHLLGAVSARFPRIAVFGADCDRNTITKLQRRRPKWSLSCVDLLSHDSVRRARVFREKRSIGLLVMNPPFSMGAKRGVVLRRDGRELRCSVALSHTLRAIELLSPDQVVAILPESALYSDLDRQAREVLTLPYEMQPILKIPTDIFRGARVATWVVRLARRHDEARADAPHAAQESSEPGVLYEVIRGSLPVFRAQGGLFPFAHTTDLLDIQQDACAWVRSARRVVPLGGGSTAGWTILLSRVGTPHCRFRPKAVFLPRTIQLRSRAVAYHLEGILRENWGEFCSSVYHGTGAKYARLEAVRRWLAGAEVGVGLGKMAE